MKVILQTALELTLTGTEDEMHLLLGIIKSNAGDSEEHRKLRDYLVSALDELIVKRDRDGRIR